jgi:hypothetical protein
MSSQSDGLKKLAATGAVIALGLGAVWYANERTKKFDALDAVPDGAFLVATVDMDRLRRSPLYAPLFADGASAPGRSLGLASVEQACGFDPVERVRTLAFVVPEEGDSGEFGVVADVKVTPDEIKTCAKKLEALRGAGAGGGGGETPSNGEPRKQGDFYVIEGKGASLPRLAYRPESEERGLLLVGKGTMVDAMMDAQTGKRARFTAQPAHQKLRASLGKSPAPALIVTAILPESTRTRIRNEMLGETDPRSQESNEIMKGVLAVDTAGGALVAGEDGGRAELRVELTCEREDACARVKTIIEKKKFELQRNLGIRLVAGPLLDGLTIDQTATSLSVRTAAPAADVARMVERALEFRKAKRDRDRDREQRDREPNPFNDRMRRDPTQLLEGGAPTPAPRAPDEVLKPKKDGG